MKTKYSIVKDFIKSKILDGTYQPHQKIKSESELMKQFGVSRHTVRLAIGDLVTEGWLYRQQGSGTFCADRSAEENKNANTNNKNIAIVTTYISDYIFPSIIRGAEARLSENGYQVSLFSTNNDHENEKDILMKILSQNFDGVIVEPTKSAYSNPNINFYLEMERLGIPYLMIHAYYEELEPVRIVMDDEQGGYMQTEHLIKLGHENILGFFKADDAQGTKRMKGYLKAHREHQIPINPNNIITYETENKRTEPVEKFKSLLEKQDQSFTAVVCYNDELAMSLLEVVRETGTQIPDDLSIVGYDDSLFADLTEVKLTSVVHPKSKMGETAADIIMELIKERSITDYKVKSVVFTPELTIRESTKKVGKLKVKNK